MNPLTVKPRRDWVMVLEAPRKTLVSGIHLPASETGVEKVTEKAGQVIRLGPGDKSGRIGLKEGDRIVYRGFLKHHMPLESEERWEDGSPKCYFLMDVADVMAVVSGDLDVGAFSSRPSQSAVASVDAEGNVRMR